MATTQTKPTLIIAKASHALSSPRKTNLVLKAIVGRPAVFAVKQLAIIPKRAADPIAKLIKQAIGNAVSQHQASPDSLIIDSAFATKGRTLKRAHIGGRGKTKRYERITSHLTVYLRMIAPKPTQSPKPAAKSVIASASEAIPAIEKPKTSKKVASKKVVKTTNKSK